MRKVPTDPHPQLFLGRFKWSNPWGNARYRSVSGSANYCPWKIPFPWLPWQQALKVFFLPLDVSFSLFAGSSSLICPLDVGVPWGSLRHVCLLVRDELTASSQRLNEPAATAAQIFLLEIQMFTSTQMDSRGPHIWHVHPEYTIFLSRNHRAVPRFSILPRWKRNLRTTFKASLFPSSYNPNNH